MRAGIPSPEVPPSALNETVESVTVYEPNGDRIEIEAAQLRAIDLGNLGIAWAAKDGKIHRAAGLPLHVVSVESRLVKPV
jgi:hypothetical protein